MTPGHDRLGAAEPVDLPSGGALLFIKRTRTDLRRIGSGHFVFVRREPHALLVRHADGSIEVLALGSEPVSLPALCRALPQWQQLLRRSGTDQRP